MEHKFTITVHTNASRDEARQAVNRLLMTTDPAVWTDVLGPLDETGDEDNYITMDAGA